MSRTNESGSSREWSHMYSDHSLCSPSTCGIARARELVQSVQQAVWLDESGGVLIPRTVTVEVVDDPVEVTMDPVCSAKLEQETRSGLSIPSISGDLEKGTIGQKLFRHESVSHSADRQLDSQLPPPLYSYDDGDLDLQLGSRYVYRSETKANISALT
jgi:hypothetical protein